jgi:hypothetical protein
MAQNLVSLEAGINLNRRDAKTHNLNHKDTTGHFSLFTFHW